MQIHHLKQLVTISQCGSINKASQKLYISQPSLNNIVKRCEEELGFTVFQRTPKGIRLTENGVRFMDSAQKIIEEYKKIEELSSDKNPNSSISVSFIYLSYILDAFLKFQEQGVLFSDMLRRTETSEVINDVVSQKVRMGILPVYQSDMNAFTAAIKPYHLQYTKLFEGIQMYAVVGKRHPLANKKKISLKEATRYPVIYYAIPAESILRKSYNAETFLRVQNRDELFIAVKSNKYLSFLSLTSDSKNPELRYIPVTDYEFKIDIYILSLANTRLSKPERTLIEFLKSTLKFL